MTEWEKRDKVIRGLECCLDVQSGWKDAVYVCPVCLYGKEDGAPCETLAPLMEDALALLKAQEPRVMTLEEIETFGDDGIVYLECRYIVDGITEVKPAIFQPDNSSPEENGYYCVVSSWGKSGFYHKENYNEDWRCWTSRPTDEQRNNTPWEVKG